MKRTPMPARTVRLHTYTALTSKTQMRRHGRLRQVSARRAGENRQRTEVLRPLREAQPWCARCGRTGVGLDGHELRSRARGGSITDPSNIVLLCRGCHSWVTEHPIEAAAEGWVI